MMRAAIIATGNELLYGKTLDSNSSYISSRLFPLEVKTIMFLVIGDDATELGRAIRHALNESDIVVMTGGLGPTDDDKTIEALQEVFGFTVLIDEPSRLRMETFFRKIGMPMTDRDLKMAEIPTGSLVLPNEKGLAPGFVIMHNDKVLIALPGVPAEVTDMVDRSVIPFLRKKCGIGSRMSLSFRVIGMKESDINASVLAMNLPFDRLEWGMTAREGISTVTIVAKTGSDIELNQIAGNAERIFGERYLDQSWNSPEEEIVDILRKRKMTIAVAESCTGGLIAKTITDVPGSSDVFMGSVVAYANGVKISQLGVSETLITDHGAVSQEVASAMAAGARSRLGATIGISTTGIAGPGGGTESKPVGTVWFGFADEKGSTSFTHLISGDRPRIRSWASLIALENLRTILKHMAH